MALSSVARGALLKVTANLREGDELSAEGAKTLKIYAQSTTACTDLLTLDDCS